MFLKYIESVVEKGYVLMGFFILAWVYIWLCNFWQKKKEKKVRKGRALQSSQCPF